MARARGRRRLALLAASLILCLWPAGGARAAGWSRPFRLEGPLGDDVLAPQIAVSSSGQAAIAFALADEDRPWISQARLVLRSPGGRLVRLVAPGAKQILALAFEGGSLELLTGSAPRAQACCTKAHMLSLEGSRFAGRPVLSGLTGATVGSLVALPGARMLAAAATDRAVWARAGVGTGTLRRVSRSSSWPQALSTAVLPGGHYALAWSAAQGLTDGASSIAVARSDARRTIVQAPSGGEVDEIALAGGRASGTLAWIESYLDASGAYHSQVVLADLTAPLRPRTYEIPGEIAGGLSFVANAAGDQVLAFRACDPLGSCGVFALARTARGRYGQPKQLGSIDPGEQPVAAVSARGSAVVGWVDSGQVEASGRRSSSGAFSAPAILSGPIDAAGLELSFVAARRALAVWTQGTAGQSVMGALLTP